MLYMTELLKNISDIVEKIVESEGFLFIDIIIRGNDKNRIIEVFVDSEKTLSAEDLAGLSNRINEFIEENSIIQGSYRLDVSTPGVERPLKYLKQFHKHLNRKFEIFYRSGQEELKLKAKLVSVEDQFLLFLADKNLVKINYKDLISAKVLISFS